MRAASAATSGAAAGCHACSDSAAQMPYSMRITWSSGVDW